MAGQISGWQACCMFGRRWAENADLLLRGVRMFGMDGWPNSG